MERYEPQIGDVVYPIRFPTTEYLIIQKKEQSEVEGFEVMLIKDVDDKKEHLFRVEIVGAGTLRNVGVFKRKATRVEKVLYTR